MPKHDPKQRFTISTVSREAIANDLNNTWGGWVCDPANEDRAKRSPNVIGNEYNMTPVDPNDERLTDQVCKEYAAMLHRCPDDTDDWDEQELHRYNVLQDLGIIPHEDDEDEDEDDEADDDEWDNWSHNATFLREVSENLRNIAPIHSNMDGYHIDRLRHIATHIDQHFTD